MNEKRCTRQFALNVKRNVKYHSSPMAADQYTAENVTLREHPQEEADTRSSQQLARAKQNSEADLLPQM
jgi:hypothetical protein